MGGFRSTYRLLDKTLAQVFEKQYTDLSGETRP